MGFLILFSFKSKPQDLVNPFAKPTLKSEVEKVMLDAKGRYGIVVKNFKTNESYYLNEKETFESGSLYKLYVLEEAFKNIKQGKLKEDKILSREIASLNEQFNIASDEAELTEGEISLTVKSAIEQMIIISHNYASLLLASEMEDKRYPQKITASEIAKFFEDLYKGKLVDEEYSKRMLELLKRQEINDRIPKNLPKGVMVAHKTADLEYFEHDGGIVFSKMGDYIIVVLSESDFPNIAGERIAHLSEVVYKYFSKN